MGFLPAFAPYIVFFLLERLRGPTAGLLSAAGASAALLAWRLVREHRPGKILEIGTAALFGGMAAFGLATHIRWTPIDVRLTVDVGLLAIVLASMACRRPFTLQYAREQTPSKYWDSPRFVRANYVITSVWAGSFAANLLADLALHRLPGLPAGVGVMVTTAAIVAAIRFTSWYSARLKPH